MPMNIVKKTVAVLFAALLVFPFFIASVFAEVAQATVSVELFSIGSGYIVPPSKVEVGEGKRASVAVMELLSEKGYVCYYGGEPESSFYLAFVADGVKSGRYNGYKCSSALYPVSSPKSLSVSVNIPEKTKSFLNKYADYFDENDYAENSRGYIGEFVFSSGSGWMYDLNGGYQQKDLSSVYLKQGDTLRLQFTLYLGVDLGGADPATQKLYNEFSSQSETTTSAPETSTERHEPSTAKNETTASKTENTTVKNETTTAKNETAASHTEASGSDREKTTAKTSQSGKKETETASFVAETASAQTPQSEPEATLDENASETQPVKEEQTLSESEFSGPSESALSEETQILEGTETEPVPSTENVSGAFDTDEPVENSKKTVIISVISAAAVVAIAASAVVIKQKKGEKS